MQLFQIGGFSPQQQPLPEGVRSEEPDQLCPDRPKVGVRLERLEQRPTSDAEPIDVAAIGADDDALEAEATHVGVGPLLRTVEHLKDSFF